MSACSGLMYSGVPMSWPSSVATVRSVSFCDVAFATPKSMILGTARSSCTETRMFDGFRSTVDDSFLVGVLHAFADPDEQLEAIPQGESRSSSQ